MNKFDKARVSVYKLYEQLLFYNNGKMTLFRKHAEYYKKLVDQTIDIAESQELLLNMYRDLSVFDEKDNDYYKLKRELINLEKSLLPKIPYQNKLIKLRYKPKRIKRHITEYTATSIGSLSKLEHTIRLNQKTKKLTVETKKTVSTTGQTTIEPFKIDLRLVNILKQMIDELYIDQIREEADEDEKEKKL